METYISREGYEKLTQKLKELKAQRMHLAREIGEAAQQGDLKENVGYTASKEKQAEVQSRINDIEMRMASARFTNDLPVNGDEVRIGCKVTLQNIATQTTSTYSLVGAEETDPSNGRISVFAPISQGLLGHKSGEDVEVTLPAGNQRYKILKIEKA